MQGKCFISISYVLCIALIRKFLENFITSSYENMFMLFVLCMWYRALNSQYFLDSLSDIIDYCSNVYDNHILIGDFNLETFQMYLETFMETHIYFNLVKNNTCFKGPGSCIDLILTNRKYCFRGTSSFETELIDHHHLTYSILKGTLLQIWKSPHTFKFI